MCRLRAPSPISAARSLTADSVAVPIASAEITRITTATASSSPLTESSTPPVARDQSWGAVTMNSDGASGRRA